MRSGSALIVCGTMSLLAACYPVARTVVRPAVGAELLDEFVIVADEKSLLPAVSQQEFVVLRSNAELEALVTRLGLPPLFESDPLDFTREMVVGSVAEPMAQHRDYRLYRIIYTPEAVEVQVVSLARKDTDAALTPYVFARIPRAPQPVHFFLNDRPIASEDLSEFKPGMYDELLTYHIHYSVYVPKHLESPAPLLVFLHSSSSNGHRWSPNFSILAEKYGFVVLTPTNRNGYYWTETYDYPAILDAIEEVKLRYPIDPQRIYAAGNSAGGHSVYELAMTNRDVFAGFASSAGRLPPDVDDDALEKGRGMPALILCGEQDQAVPIEQVLAGKARLEQFGVDVVLYSYAYGHGVLSSDTTAFEDMFRWLSKLAYGTDEPRQAPL